MTALFLVVVALSAIWIIVETGVNPRHTSGNMPQKEGAGMASHSNPSVIASLLASAMSPAAIAGHDGGQAVQWPVTDGGNGHWYCRIVSSKTWQDAKAASEALGGHLATIASAEEDVFCFKACGSGDVWLGGFRADANSPWQWVTGEPWSYANWAPGQPDTCCGNPNYLWYWSFSPGSWDNSTSSWEVHFLVEWSADCNGDGVVDFGQIRAGELADTNGNNIPDCCEQGISCTPCVADLDDSGAVNSVDLAIILAAWGTNGGKYPQADIDGSGTVDATDLSEVLAGWGPCPD